MPDLRSVDGQPPLTEAESALGVEIGAVIAGKYRVDRVIGKGGMGVVVAASQLALDRMVAIKLIRPELAEDPMAVERLIREAKAAASIKSEHVARVLDVGALEGGVPFIVMEYLEGSDLQTLLEREGPLPVADAVDLVMEACEAIAEAHRNGIVHRDIKPANLFVARLPGGRPSAKLVDFGISKVIGVGGVEPLTKPSNVVGSLYHMAPEQMRGEAVDGRTDLWALGLLLFELITGKKPFRDQAWAAVCAQVLYEPSPMLATPVEGSSAELQAILQKCLSRRREDRYDNVAELAVALSRFGTRRAQVSLERIVLLATSTGSLAAPEQPPAADPSSVSNVALAATRPVPLRSLAAPVRALDAARPPAAPSTPMPVSSSPRVSARATPHRLSFAVAGALLVVVPGLLWLWSRQPMRGESERQAPATQRVNGEGVTEPGAGRSSAGAPSDVALSDNDRTATTRVLPLRGSGGEAAAGPNVAPVVATPEATEPARPSTSRLPKLEPVRVPAAGRETPSDPSAAGAPAASHEPAPAEEAPAPGAGGAPPRSGSRPKPASPWNLDDITFEDRAKR